MSDYLSVLPQVLGEDQDVIEVNGYFALGDQIAEDVVHHPLGCGGRVCEPEEHDGGLEQALVCVECGLLFVSSSDLDIVVSPTNVELHKVFGSTKLVDELQNKREWIAVFDCHFVQLAVILYWM